MMQSQNYCLIINNSFCFLLFSNKKYMLQALESMTIFINFDVSNG